MNILGQLSIKWKIAMLLIVPVAGLLKYVFLTGSWIPVAFAATGIIAGIIVQHSICKSLFEVQQTRERMAEGKYDPVTLTTSDEVGQLARMLDSVQLSVHESQIENQMNDKLLRLASTNNSTRR